MLHYLLAAAGILILILLAAARHIHFLNKHKKELEQELIEYRFFFAQQKQNHLDYKPVEPHDRPLDCLVEHKRGHRDRRGPNTPP